jgi:cysteine desulfurase
MLPYFTHECGNASSLHSAGRVAAAAVAQARQDIATTIGTDSDRIIFTSGATEANNLVMFGTAESTSKRRKIVVSAVEHKSVLAPCARLEEDGYKVVTIPVDANGVVSLDEAANIIDDQTLLVSVQVANNEIGVIQPVADIATLAHAKGALCHADAAQALGKIPIKIDQLGVDLASFSAHKVYGPKGVGALFIANMPNRPKLRSQLLGGGQERSLRAGTLNVPGIVGFGCACRLASKCLAEDMRRVLVLREMCERNLLERLPDSWVNARFIPRLPGTISFTMPGVPADMVIANLQDLCIGAGAACNSGAPEPSHVLLAMNLKRSDAESTLRISIGRYTSESDVTTAIDELTIVIRDLLDRLGLIVKPIGTQVRHDN